MTIDDILSKHSKPSCEYTSEEFNKPIDPVGLKYASSVRFKDLTPYQKYLDSAFVALSSVCTKHNIKLLDGFLIDSTLHSTLTKEQLRSVAQMLANERLIKDDENTRRDFLSLFCGFASNAEAKIAWLDHSNRTKSPNYSTLYILFEELGVSMDSANKSIICNRFVDYNNDPIAQTQLKPREESNSSKEFRTKLKETIQKNTEIHD